MVSPKVKMDQASTDLWDCLVRDPSAIVNNGDSHGGH